MNCVENQLLVDISNLHKIQAACTGLMDAKFVNVRSDRHCAHCSKIIHTGDRVLTSSMPVDKKYNINYRQAYDKNCVKNYRYVLVRQWMHTDCAKRAIEKANEFEVKDKWYKRKSVEDIDFELLYFEQQLEILQYFYEKGDINCDEFMEIINFEALNAESQLTLLRYFNDKGDISDSEFERLENSLIDYIAFEDAVGLGQE